MVVINKAPKLYNEYLIYLSIKRLYVVFPFTVKDSFQTESIKYPTEPWTEQFRGNGVDLVYSDSVCCEELLRRFLQ